MAQKLVLPIRKFIEQRLRENYPDFDFRRSTALNDMVANVFAMLSQPLRNEIDELKIAQSLKNYDFMSEEQMNDLLFNLLIFRKKGSKAYGSVRMFFYELGDYSYDRVVFLTNDGLRYFNTQAISITPSDLSGNLSDDGTYFVDISVESEDNGVEYSIQSNQIVSIENEIPEVARVTNPLPFIQGEAKETNFETFQRSQDAIITRTLINEYSIRTVLFNEFPFLRDIKIVGAGNSSMIRDIVTINGRNIHTYGKTDIYVDTTSFQEDNVDIEYVPEDLKVNISSGGSTEIIFPESTDTSTGGNSRGLYFNDALDDFDSTNKYYNHVLRVYEERFDQDLYTDYIIKTQTSEGELVAVDTKKNEGNYLFPYQQGYISIDTLTEDHNNQYLFKGDAGQGNDFIKSTLNGPSFITGIFDSTVSVRGIDTISGNPDSCYLSISLDSTTINMDENPVLVVKQGDTVGGFPIVRVDSNELLVTGQVKSNNTIDAASLTAYTITMNDSIDRSVRVGDYLYATENNETDVYLLTISAISFSTNKIFATNSLGIATVDSDASIHDGLHGRLNKGETCFISEDWDYYDFVDESLVPTGRPFSGSGVLTTYGLSPNTVTYIKDSTFASYSINTGDLFRSFKGSTTQDGLVVSKLSNNEILVKGDYHLQSSPPIAYKYKFFKPRTSDASPILSGIWNFVAGGQYDTSVNSITVAGGWHMYHPGFAVNSNFSTSAKGKMVFVNYDTLKTYDAITTPYSTYGINGLKFSGAAAGVSNGEEWAVLQQEGKNDISGGACWGEYFNWYGTPSIDNTTLSGTYPNTGVELDLVIAAGPNKGVYGITEIANANTLKLDVELGEVSTVTATGVFAGSYAYGSTDLLTEYVTITGAAFPQADEGDTLKITSGLAEGYYRIVSRTIWGVTLDQPIEGNVFGNVDTYEVHKDRFQPFFITSNETAFNAKPNQSFEIWTQMGTNRRMVEGTNATTGTYNLTDNNVDFSSYFANVPVLGASISFVSGTNTGTQALATTYSTADTSIIFMNKNLTGASNNNYEIYQNVQNNYQQEYQIIDQLDYYLENFFVKPIINIQSVIEIDPITGETIGTELTPNSDYFLYSRNADLEYTRYSADEKILLKFDDSYRYKGMRITYLGDPMVSVVNEFATGDVMRITNNDTLVKRMESTLVNVECEIENLPIDVAEDIIDEYITTQKSENPIQASDIISLLYTSGATYVNTETFKMQSYYLPPVSSGNMWTVNPLSRTEVTSTNHATYIPGVITVTTISSS